MVVIPMTEAEAPTVEVREGRVRSGPRYPGPERDDWSVAVAEPAPTRATPVAGRSDRTLGVPGREHPTAVEGPSASGFGSRFKAGFDAFNRWWFAPGPGQYGPGIFDFEPDWSGNIAWRWILRHLPGGTAGER